jgi:hypothetical protein
MGWVKIDDGMPLHPKMIALSCNAVTLWLRALCYASRYMTDGFIPESAMEHLAQGEDAEEAIADLIHYEAWKEVDNGYLIVNYLDHQTCRKDIEAKKAQTKERVARHRCNASVTQMKRTCNANVTAPEAEAEAEAETAAAAHDDYLNYAKSEADRCNPKNRDKYISKIVSSCVAKGELPEHARPKIKTRYKQKDKLDYCEHCGAFVGKTNRFISTSLATGLKVVPVCRECKKELECCGEAANAK